MRDHSFTCHTHGYPQVEWTIPASTPQPQSITALWLVLISCAAEGRRLSWPGWLGEILRWFTYRRQSPIPVLTRPVDLPNDVTSMPCRHQMSILFNFPCTVLWEQKQHKKYTVYIQQWTSLLTPVVCSFECTLSLGTQLTTLYNRQYTHVYTTCNSETDCWNSLIKCYISVSSPNVKKRTRHRASPSMYSPTICIRVVATMPPVEARSPGHQSNVENAPRRWPITGQQRAQTPPSVRSYVVISRDGRKFVTRVRVTLP